MYEDEPQDRVHDVLAEAIFGDHPLGSRVIGSADVIGSIPVPDIAAYHDQRYVGPNLVVAAAGNLEHAHIVELAERHMATARKGEAGGVGEGTNGRGPTASFYKKDTEQYHICLGAPGIPRNDERRFALGVLDSIFGGATSSRLFREVREKRGLAYSVGSYSEQYMDAGTVATYVGTRPENVQEAVEIISRELSQLCKQGPTAGELRRAKEHVKGRMVLGLESTGARMGRIGRGILFGVPLLSLDELLARIDEVGPEEVNALAAELYEPSRFSAAAVGGDEETFRKALGVVSEELVAA
jgi:predicted Zn-dependent peptidase